MISLNYAVGDFVSHGTHREGSLVKVKPVYQQMTLSQKLGLVEISTLWHFRPIANTDVYEGSFFPQTIRDWNARPDSLISSAEDPEDCVAK